MSTVDISLISDNPLTKAIIGNIIKLFQRGGAGCDKLTICLLEGDLTRYKQLEGIINHKSKALMMFTTNKNLRLISSFKLSKDIVLMCLDLPVDALINTIMMFVMSGGVNEKSLSHRAPFEVKLSSQARRILIMSISGISAYDIARRLSVEPKKIMNQRNYAMKKLGIHTRRELYTKQNILLLCSQKGLF